jgi:Fe(3+) dicitrate transport protein
MIKQVLAIILVTGFQLFAVGYANAQSGTLKGKVTDSAGSPVEAAAVQVENTKFFATTDSKGNYKIENIPVGNYSILVEIVGSNSAEEKAEIKDKQTTELDIKLLQKIVELNNVNVVRPFVSGQGMGHMPETYQGVIYTGMKTEVLVLDSVDANKAQDNFRETLGRLPGSNYSETEGGGFPSNGIAFRGLIPTQSVEIQTRQNGYNLSGDVYGYPESYYLPPLIAVSEIQVIRGEASLQYGPQFGGIIDYHIKDGPLDKPLEVGVEETYGSYGFLSNVLTIGGTHKKWHYFAFGQYKSTNGWRPNSDVVQGTAFAKLEYDASEKFKISLEYTLLRNKIHMPGGLTDSEFHANPDQSVRARNWLTSPWNLLALTADYKVSDKTEIVLKSVGNMSGRYLVWKNEDGGPAAPDTDYSIPRQVDKENFISVTNEVRLLSNYNLGPIACTLATGVRYFQGEMWREEEGVGTAGASYDFSVISENGLSSWQDSSYFTTVNVAPFIENSFHFGNRLTITPGFRYEYIQSTASGFTETENLVRNNYTTVRTWFIPLAGVALQYKTSDFTNIYGNFAQAYEPTTYENLTPIGVTLTINPNLQDVSGFNSDLGWRGKINKFINFDVDGFYLAFNNEIGNESVPNSSNLYETNVGNAVHKGIETYIEVHVFSLLKANPKIGDFSFFNSYAYDDSKYVSGLYEGNYEEMAPVNIERIGMNYDISWKKAGTATVNRVSTTLLYSYSSQSFADANNTVVSTDPNISSEVGLIPAYTVVDWSSSYHLIKKYNYALTFGISNLLNAQYFNLRTTEYPGPGIIPAPGRNFYVGLSATF